MDPRQAMTELNLLYATLPETGCDACGTCCVSPHITFVEFAFLLQHIVPRWPREARERLVAEPPVASECYEGNLLCPLQDAQGRCAIYEQRPLICRLEGHPIMEELGVRTEAICPRTSERDAPPITAEEVDAWVESACLLANRCGAPSGEPYWLTALNLQCWFALAVDPDLERPPFVLLRRQLRSLGQLEPFAAAYVDHTGFAKKVRDVEAFFELVSQQGDPAEAIAILEHIRDAYPFTGSYYQAEAMQYLELMHQLAAERASR